MIASLEFGMKRTNIDITMMKRENGERTMIGGEEEIEKKISKDLMTNSKDKEEMMMIESEARGMIGLEHGITVKTIEWVEEISKVKMQL